MKTRGGGGEREVLGGYPYFFNVNKYMAWVLRELVGKDEYEGRRGKWERWVNGERKGSKSLEVFKECILDEH